MYARSSGAYVLAIQCTSIITHCRLHARNACILGIAYWGYNTASVNSIPSIKFFIRRVYNLLLTEHKHQSLRL